MIYAKYIIEKSLESQKTILVLKKMTSITDFITNDSIISATVDKLLVTIMVTLDGLFW